MKFQQIIIVFYIFSDSLQNVQTKRTPLHYAVQRGNQLKLRHQLKETKTNQNCDLNQNFNLNSDDFQLPLRLASTLYERFSENELVHLRYVTI